MQKTSVKGYKIFNQNWTCKDTQFILGKVNRYDENENGTIEMCEKGFHFCQNPLNCLLYYPFDKLHKYAEIVAVNDPSKNLKVITIGDKSVTNNLIIKKISYRQFRKMLNGVIKYKDTNNEFVKPTELYIKNGKQEIAYSYNGEIKYVTVFKNNLPVKKQEFLENNLQSESYYDNKGLIINTIHFSDTDTVYFSGTNKIIDKHVDTSVQNFFIGCIFVIYIFMVIKFNFI